MVYRLSVIVVEFLALHRDWLITPHGSLHSWSVTIDSTNRLRTSCPGLTTLCIRRNVCIVT